MKNGIMGKIVVGAPAGTPTTARKKYFLLPDDFIVASTLN
jgi:hypothetical protein